LRIPLESYLSGTGVKVYSLVVGVPYAPLDVDLGHLARGEWNPLTDRFRIWSLPKEHGSDGSPTCYVTIRKFDPADGVLLYGHLVIDMEVNVRDENPMNFAVGIMSNDEVRARSMLNSMLEIPPSFHRRSEVRLIERKWRSDPDAVARFMANVHSVMMQSAQTGKVYTLKFEPPAGLMDDLKRNLPTWW
jgi:hypothetical protein